MKRYLFCAPVLLLALLMGLWTAPVATAQDASESETEFEFQVPDGFAVEQVYRPDTTGSVVAITFNHKGQLVYSREGGPVVTLIESEDGYKERVVTDQVTNSQGLLFDGSDLLVVGEGPEGTGLYRVSDTNGDGTGDRVEVITRSSGRMQEHGPHNILFGPDGYLYWVLGNHTGIVPTPDYLSPHRDYIEGTLLPTYTDPRGHADTIRAPGGTIMRKDLAQQRSSWEMVAGGFRNEYDASFNLMGELFTFDSDMEWDINMPWFRPVRTVHVVPGGEYGWRTGSRKWPSYAPESLPGLTDIGRGSPTGVTFYQHNVYPEKYHDAAFYADWSRGRILAGFQEKSGATYTEETIEFVQGTPLNVTDVAVGPDGYLYFSMGGRDTQGGMFRVTHTNTANTTASDDPLTQALTQVQPRSAWSQAQVEQIRKQMGEATWNQRLTKAAKDTDRPAMQRVRALELLQVNGSGLSEQLLTSLGDDPQWQVRAASTYYLGLHATPSARQELAQRLSDSDPMAQRRASEALIRTGIHPGMTVPFDPVEKLFPLLKQEDRFVRYAAREVLERIDRNQWRQEALALDSYPEAVEGLLALAQTSQGTKDVPVLLGRAIELLEKNPPEETLRDLLRVTQRTMMDDKGIWYSYLYNDIGELLLKRFPTGNAGVDRELARTLAYTQPPGAIEELRLALERAEGDRQQQIFYAYCLRAIDGEWNTEQKDSMVEWFATVMDEGWNGGASYIGFLRNMWMDFLKQVPPEQKETVMAEVPQLSPGFESEQTAGDDKNFKRDSYSEDLSVQELEEYLIWDPMSHKGDPPKGQQAFEKAFCGSCHRFGSVGQGGFGPDLTTVGQRFNRQDLVQAILYPSKTVSDFWAAVEVKTKDGKTILGTVTDEGANSVTIATRAQKRVTIKKSNISSRSRATTSPMPDHLLHNLDRGEMTNLLLFLEEGPEAIKTTANDQ